MITCIACACTDHDACVDEITGETCAWVELTPGVVQINLGLCSFCADEMAASEDPDEIHGLLHAALDRGLDKPTDSERDEPLVDVFSDLEADRFLRARRAGA